MIDFEEQFNFTNKLKHPTNEKIIVYRHLVEEQAEYFGVLLTEANIAYEFQVDEAHEKKPRYFGIARIHEKKVDRLNFIALGRNRPKFIDSAPIRWIIIFISVFILALAIFGVIVSK
jgi:hypothetical protein